jgi:hypothetical protein
LSVFVLDKRKRPLMPCCEKRARLLVEHGRAVVVRRYPFTIRLTDRVGGELQPVRVKRDPGSKTTGIAVVTDEDGKRPAKVLALFELAQRDRQIQLLRLAGHFGGIAAARRRKRAHGFQTGDTVRTEVPKGAGVHAGRVAVANKDNQGRQGQRRWLAILPPEPTRRWVWMQQNRPRAGAL